MKQGWIYKKFSEVFNLQMGKTPSRDNNSYWGGDNVWVSISDLKGKYIGSSKEHITDLGVSSSGITKVPKGTAIMSFKLTIGRAAITECDLYTNEAIMSFAPLQKDTLLADYIYYYLRGCKWTGANKAVMGQTLNKKTISENIFAYPSIDEQKTICSLLDKLNLVIEKKKEQVAELDKLVQSLFYDMFGDPITNTKGWEISTIDNVSTDKLSYGSGASAVEYDGQTRYVRITDINDLGDLNEDIKSPSEFDNKYLLREGDILFARSGATVGKTYCHSEKNGRCIYAGYLIKMRPDKSMVMPKYVFYYTKSEYYKAFIKNAQNAVAQPNINAKQYGGLAIPVPPLPLQQAFAEKVKAIEQQKELINQSIKDVQTLFDAKMDYHFGD